MNPFFEVQCPHCWQVFSVPGPAPDEIPAEWDYDCEVCCRPLQIAFREQGAGVEAEARGLEDTD